MCFVIFPVFAAVAVSKTTIKRENGKKKQRLLRGKGFLSQAAGEEMEVEKKIFFFFVVEKKSPKYFIFCFFFFFRFFWGCGVASPPHNTVVLSGAKEGDTHTHTLNISFVCFFFVTIFISVDFFFFKLVRVRLAACPHTPAHNRRHTHTIEEDEQS